MPLIVKIYILIFILLTVSNLGYYIYIRGKMWLICYDFTAGIYLAIFMVAYYRTYLEEKITIYHVLFYLFIIGFEFYMTTFGNPEKIGIKMPEGLSKEEMENAKVLSLIFSAPAYILAGLLAYRILA